MTIKGRLFSSTAIVKRLQTENRRVTGSLPLRISQPYVALINHSGGATRPRKKFDIFIRFDIIPVCDRHATIAKTALTHSVARVKIGGGQKWTRKVNDY